MATALCAKVVPEVGGDTMFASMSAAYEVLSERLRALIDGLQEVHDIKPFKALFEDTLEDRKTLQRFEEIYPPRRNRWSASTRRPGTGCSTSTPSSPSASRTWTSARAHRCSTRCSTRR